MLHANQESFLSRVLTFDLAQLLSKTKTEGRSGQQLGPVEQGSRLELFDVSPEFLYLLFFLFFLAEGSLLQFVVGLFRPIRFGCLARLLRGRSSRERTRLRQ